jgi:Rad3-related DNA helicase
VDLPGDACRVLVIDGLPQAYSGIERREALALADSEAMVGRQIQRLEQGMGRGVRANDDHCVVLLLGSRLTQLVHSPRGHSRLGPATRAQLDLSHQVARQLEGQGADELLAVARQCIRRDRYG